MLIINTSKRQAGITLIELVITMVLSAILFGVVSVFISMPVRAYSDVAKRSGLIDKAELSLRRMERDIRQALPNSIRVKSSGDRRAIEMVNVVEGVRYRANGPGTANDILVFGTADTQFNTLGQFQVASLGSSGYQLVVYNIGAYGANTDAPTAGSNVYAAATAPGPVPPAGSHVVTPNSTSVTLTNPGAEGHVVLGSGHQFAYQSPRQRMYVIDSPITYLCDTDSTVQTITRYGSYNLQEVQPINPASAPLSSASTALLSNQVSNCSFEYQPGTSQRAGIVTISITVSQGTENVRLLQQVSVSNAP